MAYEIFTGQRLETLVSDHLDLFRAGFFGPRPGIVLQNQSLAQWLKLFLAKNAGGYATGDLLFQDEALRRLLSAAEPEGRLLFLDDLKFELYRHLAVCLAEGDPVYAPLAGNTPPDPQRLFELADHVAGVFHNYAMNSDLWPGALAAGVLPPGNPADAASFAWQSRLWRHLLTGNRGTLAGLVMERLTRTPPPATGAPTRLVLLGSAFLSRRATAFLRAWADAGLLDVVHLLLLPAPPPATLPWPTRRPWSSWGAFGRAFLGVLPAPPSAPPALQPPTALGSLQTALSTGQPCPALVPDGTLEVVSAPHPLRELEVLRDRILAALADDPTLEVSDIAVLAPDINVYAPFLDAAFASDEPGRHLRHHVIDLDLGRENSWFRALDALLSLVSGALDRPTLFTLLDTPAFREAWSVDADERELWLDYTEEVSAWREDSESGPQTWAAGSDRLFSGWFRTEGGRVPPLDAAPSAFRSLGRFQACLEALRARARDSRRARSFVEWIRFFEGLLGEFLAPGDGTGAVLSGRLRTLVRDAGTPDDPLPWAGFRAFVQDQIAHFPGRRGQLLTEGVHCSSLRPLRAIPFRFIAVLGLDEGQFPRQTPLPQFDLRRHEPDQADSSPLALDRYCFWETLMAARSVLYLSYQGRSAVDGEARPPSTVLADLLDYLEEGGTPWPVTQASVKDFSVEAGATVTWSPRTHRRALAWAGSPSSAEANADADAAVVAPTDLVETFPEVRSSEVTLAFTVPARFHLKRVRSVTLRDEDRRGVDDEEPWSLPFLDREGWLQEQFRRDLAGQDGLWDVASFVAEALATGKVRAGVFADRDRRDLTERAVTVAAWAQQLREEGWKAGEPRQPLRTRWAGRPWAPEPEVRLVRGSQMLLPLLLYTEKLAIRSRMEAAVRQLQDPVPQATLATLNPQGEQKRYSWGLDADQTKALSDQAERYWLEAVLRPLPFYPDYLEPLAKRRQAKPDEPWNLCLEAVWGKAWEGSRVARSENLLATDPYAALAFSTEPDWDAWAEELKPWWNELFVPLLGAWI